MTEHFSREEAMCRGCDGTCPRAIQYRPDVQARVQETAERLEALRKLVGRPLRITSWYRCENHPVERVKGPGATHRHTTGRAVDVACPDPGLRFALMEHFRAAGFRCMGVYRWGLHLDWTGGPRFWIG